MTSLHFYPHLHNLQEASICNFFLHHGPSLEFGPCDTITEALLKLFSTSCVTDDLENHSRNKNAERAAFS